VRQVQATPQPADVKGKAPPESKSQRVPKDSVQLSSAAQAALQEAMETPAQTAKEAGKGDAQAKRLLAREAAAKAETVQTKHVVA
jgi:hypothetical protein